MSADVAVMQRSRNLAWQLSTTHLASLGSLLDLGPGLIYTCFNGTHRVEQTVLCIVLQNVSTCMYAIVLCEVSKYLVQYPLVVCAVPVWWRVSSAPLTTTRKNNTINNHRKNLQIIISSHESCNSHLAAAPTGNHRNMAMGVSVYIQHSALFTYL